MIGVVKVWALFLLVRSEVAIVIVLPNLDLGMNGMLIYEHVTIRYWRHALQCLSFPPEKFNAPFGPDIPMSFIFWLRLTSTS